MNKRKQIALNKLFNLCIVFGLFLAWMSVEFFKDRETSWGIGFCVAALIIIIPALIFTPYCYTFDSEGVSLCYLFLPVERYLWKDVYAIEVDLKNTATRTSFFSLFYSSVFNIKGKNVGNLRFYMNGHIRKSFRTKRLLEKYWDGTITGYLFEDVKKAINKRKAKKQAQIKAHLTDEVVIMEREIRAEIRECLIPLIELAKQYNLDIKKKFFYVTEDFEELKSRSHEGYTYTLIVEIAHPNESDEDRIVMLSVDLIYVRLGKSSYRGVLNECAKEELTSVVSEALDEINKNGIESYCSQL